MYFPIHFIRSFFIKLMIPNIVTKCSFLMRFEVRSGKNVTIGNNFMFNKKVLLDGRGGKLVIGNNVDIA